MPVLSVHWAQTLSVEAVEPFWLVAKKRHQGRWASTQIGGETACPPEVRLSDPVSFLLATYQGSLPATRLSLVSVHLDRLLASKLPPGTAT